MNSWGTLHEMLVIEIGAEPWYFSYHETGGHYNIEVRVCKQTAPGSPSLVLSNTHYRDGQCSESAVKDTSHVPNLGEVGEERAQVGEFGVVGIIEPRRDRNRIIRVKDI